MNALLDSTLRRPLEELYSILDSELDTAAMAAERQQKVYGSLKQLSEIIGGEYGERVIYELLQNAHDAQSEGLGRVTIHLAINAEDHGELYVANGGRGFRAKDLAAIRNIGHSTKEIGEGIGNKGIGFRSVEALTEAVRVYSCQGNASARDGFDGYCFRFATAAEVKARVLFLGKAEDIADSVAKDMPRYLAALPVEEQPEEVRSFAQKGFATVVVLPLRSAQTVALAIRQIQALLASDVPVLLFLPRIAQLEVQVNGVPNIKGLTVLSRNAVPLVSITDATGLCYENVTLGPARARWLVVSRTVPKAEVLDAVRESIPLEPGLRRWLNWRGEATVSVAVPIDGSGLPGGRLFNFLPMASDARSPFLGHLDAPFFTSINRERARLDLPLNAYFLNAAARICAAAALALPKSATSLPARCVVDLAAWCKQDAPKLYAAFRTAGVRFSDAQIWPTMHGGWASLGSAYLWPAGEFKVFKPLTASRSGATNILDGALGLNRIAIIQGLAESLLLTFKASAAQITDWAEIIALALPKAPKGDRWSQLYADLTVALPQQLRELRGRKIILDRDLQLVAACDDVYVRQEQLRRRNGDLPPLPPTSISRKLVMLSDTVKLEPQIVSSFEKAGLWRTYNATEILERLPALFGDRPAFARRKDALLWAYEVWRHDIVNARRVLENADLHVPTRTGWIAGRNATFSQTWTEVGRELEIYLAEARHSCVDAQAAADALLVDIDDWPAEVASRQDWVRFLSDAGVADGLVPTHPCSFVEGPVYGGSIGFFLKSSKDPALDKIWLENAGYSQAGHPQTLYWREGEAWKFPGQAVVHSLSDEARRQFAVLVIRHTQACGDKYHNFAFLRKDRPEKAHDRRDIRTPLATFLATSPWFPVEGPNGVQFVRLAEAWVITDRRTQPKFIPRAPDEILSLLSREGRATELLSGPTFGLRFWKSKREAAGRLASLVDVCEAINQQDRASLRRFYEDAWNDLVELGLPLRPGISLIVDQAVGFSKLAPSDGAAQVYVRTERTGDLAKLLIDTGTPVLAVSGHSGLAGGIINAINAAGGFDARPAEDADVRLLTDGQPFRTSPSDSLIVDVVPWLAEALVLGHELSARGIEKGTHVGPVLERLRRLRLRETSSIELVSDSGVTKRLKCYLHRDDDNPTLLVAARFGALQLGETASLLAPYVHPNLRTFELLLVRLSYRLPANVALSLAEPTEADYAYAVQADVEAVREYLAAFHHDEFYKIELLTPLLAYELGVEKARVLVNSLSNANQTNWVKLLSNELPAATAQQLLAAIEKSEDLRFLRRELGFDYSRFNRVLIELGRGPLTSEAELRRLFDLWRDELRPQLCDRLRRHYASAFNDPDSFAPYSEQRKLNFLRLPEEWLQTHESIERDDVANYAETLLNQMLGKDPDGSLEDLQALRNANRKAVMSVAQRAKPILFAAARDRLPPRWNEGPSDLAGILELAGLLDFHVLKESEIIALFRRVGLWPESLPLSLDLAAHGLTQNDLDQEKKRAAEQKAEEAKRRNSIEFAGAQFDSADPDFSSLFASVAESAFSNADWLKRSIRSANLAIQQSSDPGGPGGAIGGTGRGGSGGTWTRLPEAVRSAIGLAGELLAYQYLQHKHPKHFSEKCWVSENRKSQFPEEGNSRLGYDFCVNAKEREWLYEIKATPGEMCEFELTDNEYRVAISAARDRGRRYRILFVQYALDPSRCRIIELPNPASESGKSGFRIVGRSSVRMKFELE